MKLEIKNMYGYDFVKVGNFRSGAVRYIQYGGKEVPIRVILDLVHPDFKKADESVYILCVNDKPYYVGEYSYNLSERWLRGGGYIWHHKDELVDEEVAKGNSVDIWIIVDPYRNVGGKDPINISKAIEQDILKRESLPIWNKKGQLGKWAAWREKHCIKVATIIESISANKSPS